MMDLCKTRAEIVFALRTWVGVRTRNASSGMRSVSVPTCVSLFLFAGCAGTGGSQADKLLADGNFDSAMVAFEEELAESPGDAKLLRNLGIAQLEAGRTGPALQSLEDARRADPENPQTLYFLGRAAERAEQHDLALDAYTAYLDQTGKDERVVRSHIQNVSMKKSTAQVMRALEQERDLSTATIPENTVAVADFENSLEIAGLNALSHGLAAVLVTDLSQVEELRVLERAKLQVLLQEIGPPRLPSGINSSWDPIESIRGTQQRLSVALRPDLGLVYYTGPIDGKQSTAFAAAVRQFQADQGLGVDGIPGGNTWKALQGVVPDDTAPNPSGASTIPSRLVSTETAPRIGKILGARQLIQGSFTASGAEATDAVQLGAAVLDVETGSPTAAGPPIAGTLTEVLQLEKDLVYQILESMGIDPSAVERRRIDKLATRNFLAFLAYSRGLYLEEEGRIGAATEAYREAVQLDPSFQTAQGELETITVSEGDRQKQDQAVRRESVRPRKLGGDRLIRTGTRGGIGPGPDFERDRSQEPTTDSIKFGEKAIIIISGDLPSGDNPRDGKDGN